MSRLNEYNPEFGVVFETEEERLLREFLAANPGLGPAASTGTAFGKAFANPAAPAATGGSPPKAPTGGGGNTPKAPAGPPPIPEGWRPGPTPGSILRNDGFAGATLNPATNQYEPDRYAPSAATLAAAGINRGGGGGSNVNFQAQNVANKQAIQDKGGAMQALPPRSVEFAPGRAYWHPQGYTAGVVLQWDSDTQRWVNNGYSPNTQDRLAIAQQIQQQGAAWNNPPTSTPGSAPQSPGASMRSSTPMPNAPDTRTFNLPSSVNNVAIQNPNTGFSGFLNPSTGQRAPANIGFGPATGANQILFNQNERGFSQADNPIRASYTMPANYDPFTGMNDKGFAGTTIGVTPGGIGQQEQVAFDPFTTTNTPQQATVPINLAGNNVQFSAPDKSWGTGFALNAMPHSNIALAQGRDFSNLTPAQQAVATWMLLDEQMKGDMSGAYRTNDGAFIFGGGGGGGFDVGMRSAVGGTYTYDPFVRMAGGGRVAVSPLAGQRGGPRELITNEPMFLVGAMSNKIRGLVGEDNADMDMAPDRELLSFRGDQMHVTPLDPPVRMAEGGTVRYWKDLNDGSIFENSGGIDYTGPGVEEVGDIYGNPIGGTPPVTPPTTPTEPAPEQSAPPVPIDNGGVYYPGMTNQPPIAGSQPLPEVVDTFDPFADDVLNPFQKELINLNNQDRLRNTYQYRRTAGGLGREQGVPVVGNMIPSTVLPPGMFWDTRPQVEQAVSSILSNRQQLRELGPGEDINPVMERVTFIGNALDDMQRVRDLQLQRVAAEAGGNVPSAGDGNVASWQAELGNLNEQLGVYYEGWRVNPASKSPEAVREVNNFERRVRELESFIKEAADKGVTSLDRKSIIDAQIAAIQAGIPTGASESLFRTELARLQDRVKANDQRRVAKDAIKNIAAAGVPSMTAPIVPVDPFRSAA